MLKLRKLLTNNVDFNGFMLVIKYCWCFLHTCWNCWKKCWF